MEIKIQFDEIKTLLKNKFDFPSDINFVCINTLKFTYLPLNVSAKITINNFNDGIIDLSYDGFLLKDQLALKIAIPMLKSKLPSEIIDIVPASEKIFINLNAIDEYVKISQSLQFEKIAIANDATITLQASMKQ